MPKVQFAQGVASKIAKGGQKQNVEFVDIPEYSDCCKLDCCTGGIFTKDIQTKETVVIYVENGTLKSADVATFEAAVLSHQ